MKGMQTYTKIIISVLIIIALFVLMIHLSSIHTGKYLSDVVCGGWFLSFVLACAGFASGKLRSVSSGWLLISMILSFIISCAGLSLLFVAINIFFGIIGIYLDIGLLYMIVVILPVLGCFLTGLLAVFGLIPVGQKW